MKLFCVLFAVATAFSVPASAEDSFWPGEPSGYPAPISAELRETMKANADHANAVRESIIAAGGINADFLPVWVASHPNVHWGAFGQGKSIGSNGE